MSPRTRTLPSRLLLLAVSRNTSHKQVSRISTALVARCNSNLLTQSYLQGPTPHPLIGKTLPQVLDESAEKFPDRDAFIFREHSIRKSFQDFQKDVDELAKGLLSLGLQKGDRVGIWGPNTYEWVLTQFATAKSGLILVNVNPAYRVAELEFCLRKVDVKAIVTADNFKTQNFLGMLREICPELDSCKPGALKSTRLPELSHVVAFPGQSEDCCEGMHKFSEVFAAGGADDRERLMEIQGHLQFDDPVNIQFTSGTTGRPKGATLSHHNVVNNAFFIGRRLGYHEQEMRVCYPVPLYHCIGCVLTIICVTVHGNTAVSPSSGYDPQATLTAVQEEKCTALYGTPTMFIDMLNLPTFSQFDLTSLQTGVMAGAPCPREVMKDVIEKMHMPKVTVCYGTTENSPVTFQGFMEDAIERRTGTIGYPLDHVEVKVVDGDKRIVDVNRPGELCTRGFATMLGYWADKVKTDEVIKSDRWYHTGDMAVIDEHGYGKIVGRIKDMVIRGGENIYPREIEEFIHTHTKVEDVQVVGVPDKRLGEELCAWIKLKQGEEITEDEVRTYCKGNISHFKIPHYIMFVDGFPLTLTGKVQKFIMKEKSIEQLNLSQT